jgi:hypothetical protein
LRRDQNKRQEQSTKIEKKRNQETSGNRNEEKHHRQALAIPFKGRTLRVCLEYIK